MTTLREAAQQALEALEWHLEKGAWGADIEGVTAALRERLAQQAEPVAWMYPGDYAGILKHQSRAEVFQKAWCNPAVCVPLYTAPPQRPPLTDDEIADAANSVKWSKQYHVDFARAIERAHGIGTEVRATLTKPCGSLGEEL